MVDTIKSAKLKGAIRDMITGSPQVSMMVYGYFCTFLQFYELETGTACVYSKDNKLKFGYNPEFIESLSTSEVVLIIIHECLHLIYHHSIRTMKHGCSNHKLANIAQDMIINESIKKDYGLVLAGACYIPDAYKGELIFELLYNWLLENDDNKEHVAGDEDEDGDGKWGNEIDDNDKHKSEESPIVDELIEKALESAKQRSTQQLTETINAVYTYTKKPNKVNIFKSIFGKGSNRGRAYTRPNRRVVGLKGKVKESRRINIILDTSGSLYSELSDYIGHVLGEYEMRILQCDTEVRHDRTINSLGQFRSIPKLGGGGTVLMPAIEKLISDRDFAPLYIITDGMTDTLDVTKYSGVITVITTELNPEVIGNVFMIKV